jgi:hypothetical protein
MMMMAPQILTAKTKSIPDSNHSDPRKNRAFLFALMLKKRKHKKSKKKKKKSKKHKKKKSKQKSKHSNTADALADLDAALHPSVLVT